MSEKITFENTVPPKVKSGARAARGEQARGNGEKSRAKSKGAPAKKPGAAKVAAPGGGGKAAAAGLGSEKSRAKCFPVAGVGASAGGLKAFRALLDALPADTGMAFVLVQHMDPRRESVLASLLKNSTAMPVTEAADGMQVKRNRVYVNPPNATMTIRGGKLCLAERGGSGDLPGPIDRFLDSLARDRGSGAIGVILSGTGNDGAAGLKTIKAEGGITFAQNCESAQERDMPSSAVSTGCVDFVMRPAEIAQELARMGRHSVTGLAPPEAPLGVASQQGSDRGKIFGLLRSRTGVDFSEYNQGTIDRRIRRRMLLARCERLDRYVRRIEDDPNELQALFAEIFIHVTSFFRDPEVFEALKVQIFPKIKEAAAPEGQIRIWVPGCSTGEEVYSIAIMLAEFLGGDAGRARILIFGTDRSDEDVRKARLGCYPDASVANVSPERLRRFFNKREGGYEISEPLREMCLFARHDLAKDPPFSKVSLISCRNLLSYVGPKLQERLLALFHYALNPGGFLMLGSSESISGYSHLFEEKYRKARIYVRKEANVERLFDFARVPFERFAPSESERPAVPPAMDFRTAAERIVLERYAPVGFFIDAELNVVHFQGDTTPFVKPSHGSATLQLLRLLRPELMLPVRTALREAGKTKQPARREGLALEHGAERKTYRLEVVPVYNRLEEPAGFLVLLAESRPEAAATTGAGLGIDASNGETGPEIARLKSELAATRELLRSSIADQQFQAEELKEVREEMLSSNEELQMANEELQTSKEELQSTNEELRTVNEELRNRNKELEQSASDVNSLLAAVEIPLVLLDADLGIRRFTPAAQTVLNLLPADTGRPITDIKRAVQLTGFEEIIRAVGATGRAVEREVQDVQGRWFSLRVHPHGRRENGGQGMLIALVDITHTKQSALGAIQASEAKLAAILDHTPSLIYIKDLRGRYVLINRSYERLLNLRSEEIAGKRPHDLFPRQDAVRYMADTRSVIESGSAGYFEQEIRYGGANVTVYCVEFPLRDDSGATYAICGICTDISERKLMEAQIQAFVGRFILTQEGNYRGLSREMHDVLGHKLAALGLTLGEVKRHAPKGAGKLRAKLAAIEEDVAYLTRKVHDMSRRLHPSVLDELGLVTALEAECRNFQKQHGIRMQCRTRNVPPSLPDKVSLALYRVASEALSNAAAHSKASAVKVTLAGSMRELTLRVADNGQGFDTKVVKKEPGLGLVSVKERVRLVGGSITIESSPGEGTTIQARVPLRGSRGGAAKKESSGVAGGEDAVLG